MGGRGLLVVVEGLDRSGKSTQCELLCKKLATEGRKVRYVKFPDRTTPTGKMINSYLTANRWEAASGILDDIANGTTVIIDRYSFSGAVYSAAKMNPKLSLEWAWQPEVGLPKPDLAIFLNISAEAAAKRGGYGDERYEKEEMQAKVRTLFQQLFKRLTGQRVCDVDAGGSVEQVAAEISSLVATIIAEQDEPDLTSLPSLQ